MSRVFRCPCRTGSIDPDITDLCVPTMLHLCDFLTLGGASASLGYVFLAWCATRLTNSILQWRAATKYCKEAFAVPMLKIRDVLSWLMPIQEQDWKTLL